MKRTQDYFLSTVQRCFYPNFFYESDSPHASLSNRIKISTTDHYFPVNTFVSGTEYGNVVCVHVHCASTHTHPPILLVSAPIGHGSYDALIAGTVIDAKCQSVLLIPTEEVEGWQKIDREDLWMNKTMHSSYFSSLRACCLQPDKFRTETFKIR